jgi:hypothetical protein
MTVAEAYRVQPEGEEEGAPSAEAAAAAEEEATVVKRAVSRYSVRASLHLFFFFFGGLSRRAI